MSGASNSSPEPDIDWAGPLPLRYATISSFALAVPLLIAHGALSRSPLPATGLVPLAASAGISGFLVLISRGSSSKAGPHDGAAEDGEQGGRQRLLTEDHPVVVFACDLVLATALTAVLIITWVEAAHGYAGGFGMLAAYATLPLIVNA